MLGACNFYTFALKIELVSSDSGKGFKLLTFVLCKICLNTKHRIVSYSYKVKYTQSSFQGARVEIVGFNHSESNFA